MIEQLVVNGCSYMEVYAMGNGHQDLADRLGIKQSSSLAIGGSANSRIIRTTLKHSYQTQVPTFYVLGMTFLSRNEIPILNLENEFEGRWTNPQNQQFADRWQYQWTQRDTDLYVELKLKSEWVSIEDRLEDLMYRIVSMISDLHRRGHRVLIYQQADDIHQQFLDDKRFDLFRQLPCIIDGYRWCAVPWQDRLDVPVSGDDNYASVPKHLRHRRPGDHQILNQYLAKYIGNNHLLKF